jgi:addiction module HigA family antidote
MSLLTKEGWKMAKKKLMEPVHPGEILKGEFLDEMNVSAYALAQALRVPTNRITSIVNGERGISAETALRLARFFGTTPDFWMNLQSHYDLTVASRAAAAKIEKEVPKYAATA